MESMIARDLSVTLTMPPEIAQTLARESGALIVAEAFVVDGPEMAVIANEELRQIKARAANITAMRDRFIAKVQEFFNQPLRALSDAEALLKSRLLTYQIEQSQIANEARLKVETEERARRQKAEQVAAAARAEAEERARQERAKAAQAEKRRQEAEAAGNAAAARAAAEAAAKANERAQAATENGEAKAQEAILTAAATAPTVVVPVPVKLAGFSTRDNWTAEMTAATEAEAVRLIVAALPERPDFAAYLKIDALSLNKLAKAQKDLMAVPGFRAKNTPISASRAA